MKFSKVLTLAVLSGGLMGFTGCGQDTNDAGIQGQNAKVQNPPGGPTGSSQEEYMKHSMQNQMQNPSAGAGGYPGAEKAAAPAAK